MKNIFYKIKKFILDILFPINCLSCGKDEVWLCEECQNKIQVGKSLFEKINFSPSYVDGFFIAADWEDKVLQDVIRMFKYNFVQELVHPLSYLLIQKIYELEKNFINLKNYVIVPVPLHQRRLAWRGFNQAELLSQFVAKEFDLEINNNLLIRKKYTSPQVRLKSKKRQANISGAFELNCRNTAMPRFCLLIDDVITTGATMNEIARVLKNSGVKKVLGIALARG